MWVHPASRAFARPPPPTPAPKTPNPQPRAAWEVAGSADADADGPGCTNGFAFEGADAGGLDYALNRAIDAFYNDRAWFRGLQARVMRMDWSWNRPALAYVDLYYAATKQ